MAKKTNSKETEIKYTKFEKARIIGARALQLSMGAPFNIKLTPKNLEELQYNVLRIATKEFEEGVVPITVKRIVQKTS